MSLRAASAAASHGSRAVAVLALADTMLLHAQRISEWVGRAPMLEEEMASANIALDILGQASRLYEHAAAISEESTSPDELAYGRDVDAVRAAWLAVDADRDFAELMIRLLLLGTWYATLWDLVDAEASAQAPPVDAGTGTSDPAAAPDAGALDPTARRRGPSLAGIASKARPEVAYHLRHAGMWVERLAGGTDESRARSEAALARLWPMALELVDAARSGQADAGAGLVDAAMLADQWQQRVLAALDTAGLVPPLAPAGTPEMDAAARRATLAEVLAELQHVAREHPGATW